MMLEEIQWEQGRQMKEVQSHILEIRRDIKDIPEIKSSLSQLMGMVTSLLDKAKQKEKQPIHLEEDVAVAGCGVSQQWGKQFGGESISFEGIQTKIIRLEFPTFNGEDPDSWCNRAEQFIDFYEIQERQKLRITAFHMEGKALSWFTALRNTNNLSSWDEFLVAIQVWFDKSSYNDPM